PPVLVHQLGIRERRLRVLLEELQVRVGRRAVDVEVVLLDVFAVVAFAAGQGEQSFLQERIAAVPEREGEADALVAITNAGQAVLVPSIGPRARMVVREAVPRGAAPAVALADATPGAFAEIRPLPLPVADAPAVFVETELFGGDAHRPPLRCR